MIVPTLLILLSIAALIYANQAFAVTDSINVNLTVAGAGAPPPPPPPPPTNVENTAPLCSDFLDNDNDTLIDFNDPDCLPFVPLIELEISAVNSLPSDTSAKITWLTNLSAISTISWGLTLDYELGTSVEGVATTTHQFTITNLLPNTQYFYKISAYQFGNITNTDQVTGLSFTTEEGQDVTPPSVPINFDATYDDSDEDVNLTWTNPSEPDFDVVRIMRSETFFPTDETEGVFIYEGNGTQTEDEDVEAGITYYYSIFAKDDNGNWSAGAVDVVSIPPDLPDEECVGEDCECVGGECQCVGEDCVITPPDDDCVGADCETPDIEDCVGAECDPFEFDPPKDVDPEILKVIFKLSQNGIVDYFTEGSTMRIDGNLPFKLFVDYDDLPEVLKTIGITLRHPSDKKKVFSFILRVDSSKTEYLANVGPLLDKGLYDMSITILDHKNQGLRRINGALSVSEGRFINTNTITTLRDIVSPIGQTVGVAAGITQTVIAVTNIRSVYDIYLLVSRLIAALLGFLGVRRKSKPWGTVYDSVTKRPLDPAYVSVTETSGEEKSGAITDLDGRYGFFLPKGVYKLSANKTHYAFPSKKLSGKTSDELYADLYFGEPIATEEGQIIDRNIPLDPVGFDWNEFEKNKQGLYVLYSRKEKIKTVVFNTIYVFGLASSLFALVFSPSPVNLTVMIIYVLMFAFQLLWGRRHRATSIFYGHDRNPLAFGIVRVFTAELNEQVKAVVADEYGRFYLLISPGSYYITVDAKETDGSYKRIYKSDAMELKKGILPKNILIQGA